MLSQGYYNHKEYEQRRRREERWVPKHEFISQTLSSLATNHTRLTVNYSFTNYLASTQSLLPTKIISSTHFLSHFSVSLPPTEQLATLALAHAFYVAGPPRVMVVIYGFFLQPWTSMGSNQSLRTKCKQMKFYWNTVMPV